MSSHTVILQYLSRCAWCSLAAKKTNPLSDQIKRSQTFGHTDIGVKPKHEP